MIRFAATALLVVMQVAAADSGDGNPGGMPPPIPDPLTLEQALAYAELPHPALARAEAAVALARADELAVAAGNDPELIFSASASWIEPSDLAADQDRGDHQAHLVARKQLYDFGYTRQRLAAANLAIGAAATAAERVRADRRVAITAAFHEVLIADLEYARINERMAIAYVTLDKLRDRRELGQASDLDLLASESEFQQVRRQMRKADGDRRLKRARLATALGRPGDLPATLVPPPPATDRELPPLEELIELALANAPALAYLRAREEAVTARRDAARLADRPTLTAEIAGHRYNRELGGRNPWEAGVVVEVPLWRGGRNDAVLAARQAELQQIRAERMEAEFKLREEVRSLRESIATLTVQLDESRALRDYRELYLDRSRALYEMEFRTDLGDAMVHDSAARLFAADNRYQLALAWLKLDLLIKPPSTSTTAEPPPPESSQ
jgi:outer membrane protein TolC